MKLFTQANLVDFGVLLLAQLMGAYFLSTLLMLKLTLPPEYRVVITELFQGINLGFFGHWFDRIFLISIIGSLAWLGLRAGDPVWG